MAAAPARTPHVRRTDAPVLCPAGGQPLESSERLFAGHPLHRRADVTAAGVAAAVPLHIRPVLPSDVEAIAAFFAGLSLETAYRRFHAPLRQLSPPQLAGIVDVDHHERETLLAFIPGPSPRRFSRRRPQLVAVAQYIRVDTVQADMAIVVADRWQRHGVGRLLAAHLGRAAAESGIAGFDAVVLADNPAPQRLARSLSPAAAAVVDGPTVALRIPLPLS